MGAAERIPDFKPWRRLPERDRWQVYAEAKRWREKREMVGEVFAEQYDDFIRRLTRELEI